MPRLRSALVLLLLTPFALGDDWPQWLGPNRDNSTREIITPWKEAPKVLWSHPVGEGNSAPTIAAGRVFIHSKVKDKIEEEVIAYDAVTGKKEWRYSYPRAPFKSAFGNGPRATPAVADGKVYTFGLTGVLNCLEASSGQKVWSADTLDQFKGKNLLFGMACSPLIDKGHVFLDIGAEKASIVALDAKTGDVAWQNLDDKASYSSPILIGQGAERQLIFLTAKGLTSLDPATGKLFWQFPLVDLLFESSTTPVKVGNRVVASSITYGTACLSLETKDGKPSYKEEWKNPALTSYFSTPVAVGTDYLYLVTGTSPAAILAEKMATLNCVDMKTGKALWKKEKVGTYHAALLRTGDNKLLMLEEKGDVVLLEPNPREYKELCQTKHVCGSTWAHPILVDGKLYLRDNKEVRCVELGK